MLIVYFISVLGLPVFPTCLRFIRLFTVNGKAQVLLGKDTRTLLGIS